MTRVKWVVTCSRHIPLLPPVRVVDSIWNRDNAPRPSERWCSMYVIRIFTRTRPSVLLVPEEMWLKSISLQQRVDEAGRCFMCTWWDGWRIIIAEKERLRRKGKKGKLKKYGSRATMFGGSGGTRRDGKPYWFPGIFGKNRCGRVGCSFSENTKKKPAVRSHSLRRSASCPMFLLYTYLYNIHVIPNTCV